MTVTNGIFAFVIALALMGSCRKSGVATADPIITDSLPSLPPPMLKGKLIYHRYDSYGDKSSLYLYDFSSGILKEISAAWNLHDPMNAHFNREGTQIVFMAQSVKEGKWDIYLWSLQSETDPVNLTADDNCRDEDPKFSPGGDAICFKRTKPGSVGNIVIMKLADRSVQQVTDNTIESGMPYFSADGQQILYAQGSGAGSDIYSVDTSGTNNILRQGLSGIEEYYPIGADSISYFYSRWSATSNAHDQVYRGYYSSLTAQKLSFNTADADYSDAFPYDDKHILLSCDKKGGQGAYDLYIADLSTGSAWSLNRYNAHINTSGNELGACYNGHK